jgi:hypothetical protein
MIGERTNGTDEPVMRNQQTYLLFTHEAICYWTLCVSQKTAKQGKGGEYVRVRPVQSVKCDTYSQAWSILLFYMLSSQHSLRVILKL